MSDNEYMVEKLVMSWPVRVKRMKHKRECYKLVGFAVFYEDRHPMEGFGQTYEGHRGHFCGYIKCSEKLPIDEYWGEEFNDFDVYGGLTFSNYGYFGRVLGWDYNHGRRGEEGITLDYVIQEVEGAYETYVKRFGDLKEEEE